MMVRDLREELAKMPQGADAKWVTYDEQMQAYVATEIHAITSDASGNYVALSVVSLDELCQTMRPN